MARRDKIDIGAVFEEGTAIDEAMRRAWYRAVRRHRRLGIPLLVSENGKIVELDPFSVDIPEGLEQGIDPDTYMRAGA
jgi:hypothetical protein